MNKTERAKVTALQGCRLAFAAFDRTFLRNMAWVREHEPGKTMTPPQKWALDVLVYKYRRQLGGHVDFEIPAEPPQKDDYGIQEDQPKQKNIFGGEDKPRRTRIQTEERSP